MGLITNCLTKLVKSGQISQKAADAARTLHEGMQGKLNGEMPPAHADAAAALEAARVMGEGAKREKLKVLADAIAYRDAEAYVNSHPNGRVAGVMGLLDRDIHGIGRLNWESHGRAVETWLLGKANAMLESYRSKLGGLSHDYVGPRNVIKELRGVDTGDSAAKEAAAAWKAAVDAGTARAEKAGLVFGSVAEKSQWLHPQFWESSRVKRFGPDVFRNDVLDAWKEGSLKIMSKVTGKEATALEVPGIIDEAYKNIAINESGAGHGSAFNDTMRVFNFQNADGYLALMDKYGPGQGGIYGMMLGHLKGMAHSIAGAEVLGPSHKSNFYRLLDTAKLEDSHITGLAQLHPLRRVESVRMADLVFKSLNGELNSVDSEVIAGIGGALRNVAQASQLGGAVVTAVPGDSVTAVLAAQHVGMSGSAVLSRAVEGIFRESPELRAEAARLGVTAHAVIDHMQSAKRYTDQFSGTARFGQLSSFVMRAQGLNFWTENLKRAWSMEFAAHIAENAATEHGSLNPAFRRFLDRYGFTAEDWDAIRSTAPLESDGARFFNSEGMADRKLAARLMSAIIDERQFAVLEGGARIGASLKGAAQRGTFSGELAASFGMYKSFPMALILTHGMRRFQGPSSFASKTMGFMMQLILPMTLAGAATQQAKALLAGRDPRDMTDPLFWKDAFFVGGAAGIYGDLIKQSLDGSKSGLGSIALGPVGGLAKDTNDLTFEQWRKWSHGDKTNFGATMAKVLRNWSPKLFYTRTAMDRLIFDEIQQAIDPNYLDSFRRQEENLRKNTGQKFWWHPGDAVPERAPDLGAALGKQSSLQPATQPSRKVAAKKGGDIGAIMAALQKPRNLHTDMAGKTTGVAGAELPEVASDPRLQELLDALKRPKKFKTDAAGNVTGVELA